MFTPQSGYPLCDLSLARRLERAEAAANAATVAARARLQPEVGATWIEVAGAYALFDGVGSFLTQSFGLGLFDPVDDAELTTLEAFFEQRGSDAFHEVSPVAEPALLARLTDRGYQPVEFTNVLYRPTSIPVEAPPSRVRVRRIAVDEAEVWARVAAEGWSTEAPELAEFMFGFGLVVVHAEKAHAFLAELNGRPIAAGSLNLDEEVALLSGASTVAAARRQGAQRALLQARLAFAAEQGRGLALMGARPGSGSQRNAERQGFRVAYTRIKWRRHRVPDPIDRSPAGHVSL